MVSPRSSPRLEAVNSFKFSTDPFFVKNIRGIRRGSFRAVCELAHRVEAFVTRDTARAADSILQSSADTASSEAKRR
jgi:hypothetical protein